MKGLLAEVWKGLDQLSSTGGDFCPLGDIWKCLNTFLAVIAGR